MQDFDTLYSVAVEKYAKGGEAAKFDVEIPLGIFNSPTGKPTKLNYIEQLLVRTKEFKKWFGDWEQAAIEFKSTDMSMEKFVHSYHGVSKCIDMETLEPRVYYHGTKASEEFYEFDVHSTEGKRPYAYFAVNKEYSQFFAQSGYMYRTFLRVMRPLMITDLERHSHNYADVEFWMNEIAANLLWYRKLEYPNLTFSFQDVKAVVASQLQAEMNNIYAKKDVQEAPFWYFMSFDQDKIFKTGLMANKFDGITYYEELALHTPKENLTKANFTEAIVIFDASQVKLADGRNTTFNAFTRDIRFKEGGNVDKYEVGGTVKTKQGHTDDAKKGGLFHGRSHDEGGIKAMNVSTGQPIEVEGGEVIITKKAVEDNTKREFEGEMLTNKEILSRINERGGGVKFEDGGEIHDCACNGHEFKFGGETLKDYDILKRMNTFYTETKASVSEQLDKFLAMINQAK